MPEPAPSPVKRLQFANGKPFEIAQPVINRILNKPTVIDRTSIPRGTLDDWIGKGLFPAPIALGPRRVGWLESDVKAWIDSRPLANRTLPSSAPTTKPTIRRGRPPKAATVATGGK